MTTDEVLQAVKEAGFGINHAEASAILFTRFAALVAAAEREDILRKSTKAHTVHGHCDIVLSADIRARSTP